MNRAPRVAVALVLLSLALIGSFACRPASAARAPAPPAPSYRWARQTLARMSLEEKVAQMIGVRAFGLHYHPASEEGRRLRHEVRDLGVGSVVVFESEVDSLPRLLNGLQALAKLPLLVSADMERGMSFRIRRGVVPLPYAMAIGATRSEEAARFTGEVTAREGRALGIHWALAPVADVNNNPGNPVINIRSYGEDPELVARLDAAFVRGARAGGLLTTAKHFPGHGDTAVDSHLQLATVGADRARLESVELRPFRRAVEAGVDSVMLGHIAVPAVDPTGAPATLSAPMATDLLRQQLHFEGLIVTDAMEMAGVKAAWTGEAAIRAVRAGADMILLPPQSDVAIRALVRAVREGQLAVSRIDASVLRILEAKERLGLDRQRRVDPAVADRDVGRPQDVERALEIARRAITVVKNDGGVLPLRAEQSLRILHLVLSSDLRSDPSIIQGFPEDELARRAIPTQTVWLGPDISEETAARIVGGAGEFTHVLASSFARVGAFRGTADMPEPQARLMQRLHAAGRPLIVVSYGSPYMLRQFPEVPVYVCSYGWAESSQRAAVSALFGEHAVAGRLPVTLPGLYPYGHGLDLPRREMTLRVARPEDVGFRPDAMAEVDRVADEGLAAKAFPGGVLAVGKDSALVHVRPFGRFSYDDGAPEVKADTIYDVASLTKVVATTTMAMILVDEGKLDVRKPVSSFISGFRGGAKETVTVESLLTHSSGLAAWAPLYKEVHGKEEFLGRVVSMDLAYVPGTKSVYSDLGFFLLGEVLERVAGEPIDAFVTRRVFEPLGMRSTMFCPSRDLVSCIPPTERDAWRGRLVRGEVHDENAFAVGGVAAHAGLFSTAGDLARFAQMLLNGGVYDSHRIVSRATLERFTKRAGVPDSARAYGWDTPYPASSAGDMLSPRAFGHTGFTGTSIWIDPERNLFVILLTNRVHPTRENDTIRQVRRHVADAVVGGLVQP